jgi:hypothetical protein
MKESLQEQLAKLTKSGGLQASIPVTPAAAHTSSTSPPKTINQSAANPYESLILEVERLRNVNVQLVTELNSLKVNPDLEMIQLKDQLSETVILLQGAENSNSLLASENIRLTRELANRPSYDEALSLRARAIEADASVYEANELAARLELERQQLADDRTAFEADLEKLDALEAGVEKLKFDQQALLVEQGRFRIQSTELESTRKRIGIEKGQLDKRAIELKGLHARVGHFKGIESELENLRGAHAKLLKLHEAGKNRIRTLKADKELAEKDKLAAEVVEKKTSRHLKEALSKLAKMPDSEFTIRSFETVEWLVSQFDDLYERVVPKQVLLIGDGPWPLDNFTELLQSLGFKVWQNGYDAEIEIVIVGRENWKEEIVDSQIEKRDGKSLRIYSQELFILLLAMQADPLEVAESEPLKMFVEGHPVFEYLFNQEFPWPETAFDDRPPVTIGEGFDSDEASSPLYRMGYSVAQQLGLTSSARHDVLVETYQEENLPWCISDEYMEDWGQSSSRKRLRRIAWHLHLMTKRFRRHAEAVARWESDLNWLKKRFYKPIHRFHWPT